MLFYKQSIVTRQATQATGTISAEVKKPSMKQNYATDPTRSINRRQGGSNSPPSPLKTKTINRGKAMQGYRTVRTSKNGYKFIKKDQEYDLFTKISNKIFPYVVGVMAAYGFIDFILTANGF